MRPLFRGIGMTTAPERTGRGGAYYALAQTCRPTTSVPHWRRVDVSRRHEHFACPLPEI
jgi:hypothetical protein